LERETMKRRAILGVAVLAVLAMGNRGAAAQGDRLSRRLDSATNAQVQAAIDSARQAGLPVEPLIARALEGASKNATGARIVAAVQRLAADLTVARRALGDGASAAELEAGASALRAGVDTASLIQLREARPGQPLTVPLAVLSDLVARGVPADPAASFVLAIARASDEQYVAFQRNVERDIALGAPPIAAAAVRVAATSAAPGAEDQGTGIGGTPRPRPRRP
jgi:hypothetical protein